MASSNTARCLFCRLLPRQAVRQPFSRSFSIGRPREAVKKGFPSIKASDMPRDTNTQSEDAADVEMDPLRPYTEREKKLLALKYTPAQLRAIEAGEAAIDPQDIIRQGRRRVEPMTLQYRDDFSRILPFADKPVRAPDEDIDPDIRMLSEAETKARFGQMMFEIEDQETAYEDRTESMNPKKLVADIARFVKEAAISPDDGRTPQQRMAKFREVLEYAYGPDTESRISRFGSDMSNFIYSPKGTANTQSSSLSEDIPRMEDKNFVYTDPVADDGMAAELARRTGKELQEISQLSIKTLVVNSVTNQTRMGKIRGFYVLVIAGDGNGMLGVGEGNKIEIAAARLQATRLAIMNMKPILRYENRTIYGEVETKVGASVVRLSARYPGFGNRCQSLIFEMARAAGISDLSARCIRSKNPMNVCKATYKALLSQKLPDEVARARGLKMVDVRKVYYQDLAA